MSVESEVLTKIEYRAERKLNDQSEFASSIKKYLTSEAFINLGQNTQLAYSQDLFQFENFCQEHQVSTVNQLAPEIIIEWKKEMETKYKINSVNRKIAAVKFFVDWTIAERLLPPEFKEKLPEHMATNARRPVYFLKLEEINELVNKTKETNPRDAALVQIALKTGARTSEIVELKVDDILIDSETSQISVRYETPEKSRTVALDEEARQIIIRYIDFKKLKLGDFLFPKRRNYNEHLRRQGFWLILKGYVAKIDVLDLTPAILRNTFLSQNDIKTIRESLGISDSFARSLKKATLEAKAA